MITAGHGPTRITTPNPPARLSSKSRVERLVSAWSQGIRDDAESEDGADDPLIDASAERNDLEHASLTRK